MKALLGRRIGDVTRFFLLEEAVASFRDELRALAVAKKAYRVVPRNELDALAEGAHHEGVCAFALPLPERRFDELLERSGPVAFVALPGVGNPHNLGAILRSAAHFGIDGIVLEEDGPRLTAAAARTAEGGAEHVPIVREATIDDVIRRAKARGLTVLATSSHPPFRSLYASPMPARVLVLFGAEGEGLSPQVVKRCDGTIAIPGTGHVESLNVATAVAVVLSEIVRSR